MRLYVSVEWKPYLILPEQIKLEIIQYLAEVNRRKKLRVSLSGLYVIVEWEPYLILLEEAAAEQESKLEASKKTAAPIRLINLQYFNLPTNCTHFRPRF